MKYAIEYAYPGTHNGKPVGRVFLMNIEHITLAPDTWSYTRDINEASHWDSEEEAQRFLDLRRYPWPATRIVPVG